MTHAQTKSREYIGVADEPIKPKTQVKQSNGIRVVYDTNGPLFNACYAVYKETFTNDVDLTKEMIKQGIDNGTLFMLCLPDQDGITPIGVAIMGDLADAQETPIVMLDYFFINPAKRGKGIGTSFFGNIVRYLRDNTPYKYMVLECVSKLVGFYEKLGARPSNLNPSVCLVSKNDLSSRVIPDTLLYLMVVPLDDNQATEIDRLILEKALRYARFHIHAMTLQDSDIPANTTLFNVWSRR
jgi:GNAT superfamily N-acetyltransferase